jgi:IS30 family transposase
MSEKPEVSPKKRYMQLQPEERLTIASLLQQRKSLGEIARTVGRSTSTIGREVRRNACAQRGYASAVAQQNFELRRKKARPKPKLAKGSWLRFQVLTLLQWKWSPEQIASTLARMNSHESGARVSHETIYNTLYAEPRGELRREFLACLRWQRSKRKPRSGGVDRSRLANALSIHVRPPEIQDRLLPGHWEGDFIKGAGNRSAVGVLVERKSRLVMLAKMPDSTAASALEGFAAKLNAIPEPMRQSLTYDRGTEMARHVELTQRTLVKVYFCDPHSPWQRGSCENTNGLLRQYLPKGTDLSVYSQEDLDGIADSLNGRPRATLDWDCPLYFYEKMLALAHPQPTSVQ